MYKISKDQSLNNLNVNTLNANSLNVNLIKVNESFSIIRSPTFLCYLATDQNNKTGQGEFYQLGDSNTLAIAYNRGMGIDTDGKFTALYDGIYQLAVNIETKGYATTNKCAVQFVVYVNNIIDRYYSFNSYVGNNYSFFNSAQIQLNKDDYVYVFINVGGEGSTSVDILGLSGVNYRTTFYGNLI